MTLCSAIPLAMSLQQTTFVVVDLETTGGTPDDCGITEIGAVKACGGEELGEFGTLVNPGQPIPPFVTVLTGITEAMIAPAPRLEEALPAFLEFARGAVLVAHNAPYDIGFLKAACAKFGYPWPQPKVLDTVAIARRALTRDEVPNHKLSTLASFFGARPPSHRALDDARATVDVLHALFGRLGSYGVFTLGDTIEFAKAVTADAAPQAPSRRRPAQHAGGVRVPRRRRPPALRRRLQDDRDAGQVLLHGGREARPDLRDARTRPSASRPSSALIRSRPRSASCD